MITQADNEIMAGSGSSTKVTATAERSPGNRRVFRRSAIAAEGGGAKRREQHGDARSHGVARATPA